jgi:hypothetical protein
MGVFQLSNRGLHPLGQLESGIMVPLIGARETTVLGGAVVSLMTLLTVWRVPALCRYRWDGKELESAVGETASGSKLNLDSAVNK